MARRQLTDRFVRTVRSDRARRFQFQDSAQEGLVLQVEPLTAEQRARQKPLRKTLKLYYARMGRPRWYSLGSAGALTLAEHARRRNRSWRQANKLVRRYLLPSWGSRRTCGGPTRASSFAG